MTPSSMGDSSAPEIRVNFNRLILVLAIIGASLGVIGVGLDIYLRWPIDGVSIPLIGTVQALTHPSGESTIYSWYSTILLASVAVAFAAIALAKGRLGKMPWQYHVMAATTLILSLDEAARLHERSWHVASGLGIALSWTYGWLAVGVPLAIVAGVLLVWIARSIDPLLRKRLIIAGVVFFLGAVGVETLGGPLEVNQWGLPDAQHFLLFNLSMFVEESLEIAGALIALWAALSYLRVSRTPEGFAVSVDESGGRCPSDPLTPEPL
jgi:hypothetical protein